MKTILAIVIITCVAGAIYFGSDSSKEQVKDGVVAVAGDVKDGVSAAASDAADYALEKGKEIGAAAAEAASEGLDSVAKGMKETVAEKVAE